MRIFRDEIGAASQIIPEGKMAHDCGVAIRVAMHLHTPLACLRIVQGMVASPGKAIFAVTRISQRLHPVLYGVEGRETLADAKQVKYRFGDETGDRGRADMIYA